MQNNRCLRVVMSCMLVSDKSDWSWVCLCQCASPTFDRHTAQLLCHTQMDSPQKQGCIQTTGYFWTQCLHHDNWATLRSRSLPSTTLLHSSLIILLHGVPLCVCEMLCLLLHLSVVFGCLTWCCKKTRRQEKQQQQQQQQQWADLRDEILWADKGTLG